MAMRLLLLWPWLALLCGPCVASSRGKEFVTAFLCNSWKTQPNPKFELFITGYHPATTVTVTVNKPTFQKTISVNGGQTMSVQFPTNIEMVGTGIFDGTVRVQADKEISVFSYNYKYSSTGATTVYPVDQLGTLYYAVTPEGGGLNIFKEFAVVANRNPTRVTVHLKGRVTFKGQVYLSGSKLVADLSSFQTIQLQSTGDLSGTRVESNEPVAVLSGHSCAWKFTKCDHVVEQLLPVPSWGTFFIVPPLSLQSKYDIVYIIASQNTVIKYESESIGLVSRNVVAGELIKVDMQPSQPLLISADVGLQVLFFFTGAKIGTENYDPFLINVPATANYCVSYKIDGIKLFENYAVIITTDTSKITLQKAAIGDLQWKPIFGTEYFWAERNLGKEDRTHSIEHPSFTFGLFTFGIAHEDGYGSVALCSSNIPEPSCSSIVCKEKEVCQILKGQPVCVPESGASCWAQGDPHYHTFDGRKFDFMGTCTYTIAKTCGLDPTLPSFSVEAKNDLRGGNTHVSYVGSVTVRVYNFIISVVRNENGFVRINYQRFQLPISLHEGKLQVYQSGSSAFIETDFGLKVSYDWSSYLVVKISGSFSGSLCGLCGNFDGDAANDFSTPDGTLAPTPGEFGRSWKVEDGDRLCHDDCQGGCKTCPPETANKYKAEAYCGLIMKEGNGPFSQCHSVVDPSIFLDNCAYDLCLTDGLKNSQCEALKSYADACQRAGVTVSNWRMPSGCPLPCPENSQYKACASPCPATCNDQAGPSNCASLPCVETCQCNEGFVLDAGKCIPKASCGCVFEGKLFSPGEQFWGDRTCTRRCLCEPRSRQVTCQTTSCRGGEQCKVENGIQNCYPTSFASCSASGDPHYIGFDGQKFDFQGTCLYQFVGLCERKNDLVNFLVLVQNDHRGSRFVSFTKAVELNIYGHSIVISREYPAKVMVNGLLTNLPYRVGNNKVSIYRRGQEAVVETDFFMSVTFDWESRITVTVPSAYAGALCGLCGNFNGNKQDDMMMRDGNMAPNPRAFGQSWKARDIPGCTDASKECPGLETVENQQRNLKGECGLLLDKSGPFRECHGKIDPEGYFGDCVYDYCFFEGRQAVICQLIASYAAACQAAGVTIYAWRSDSFCSLPCGPNSHYELCASDCVQTCGSLYVPTACTGRCHESCVCDEYFVLSGDRCVAMSECGCYYQERYYLAEEIFYPTCEERCTCYAGGIVNCEAFACGPNEECRLENGIQKCYPDDKSTCSVDGGTHYISFDQLPFDFHGTCTYTLSKTKTNNQNLIPFIVNVENGVREDEKILVPKMVSVSVYGVTLKLLKNKPGQVKVDDIFQPLPVTLFGGRLRVYQHGTKVLIEADCGLSVSYDFAHRVTVTVPSNYQDQVNGLCGNYNGQKNDEFLLPDGRAVTDVNAFGAAWKVWVPGTGGSCLDGCPGNKCPVCEEKKKEVFKQRNYCGILTAADGPFGDCHAMVDPNVYLNNCIYDLCLADGDIGVLCQSIASYVSACQDAEVSLKPWRTPSLCPLKCPANSHYEVCTDLCSTNCAKITDRGTCPDTCAEGCQCDDGFFFDGRACVTVGNCGCFKNGHHFKPNEKVLLNDCQESCTCITRRGVICEAHSCASDEKCDTKNGVMRCIKKDPCKALKCQEKETCKIENNQATCVPDFTVQCWGWGDPHYHTFDGFKFDFQGTCTYTFAKYCGNDPTLVPFTIDEKNDNRGNQAVSYVRQANIYVYGYKISIYKQETGRIRLNDAIRSLPLTLENGKIKLSQSGNNAVLQTDFGLQVTYDWNWHLIITLPSSYYGAMCGLCGNFNQNPGDDMSFVNGTKAPSIERWASSWKVKDHDPFCWDSCKGNCPTCDEQKQQLYRKEEFCGLIGKSSGGPFRDCHFKVNPDNFLDSCTYDVCMNGGAKNILCQALEAYAKTCRKAGAIIQDWRTPSGCALQCPENSHYEFCGNACPASCADRSAPDTCKEPCVETCQCNDGFVLSVDKCVPVASCGCTYNGFYYKPGEQFWADENCGTRCRCDPRLGNVVCYKAGCKANERCTVVNGIRDCHPLSYATCLASGDPHYTTFDGRKYDFMGTCVYQLAGLCSDDPTLRPFAVYVQNNNRGNKKVSYTKVVTLEVYSVTITLSQEYPRRVQVNDVFVNLPFNREDKVKVYISGNDGVIKTDFGLTVTFDWYSYVRVSVPNTYANALCGLCGNNNQNTNDDLAMKDGSQARGVAQFAESWKVADVPGCSVGCTDDCPACAEAQKQTYQSNQYCGILRRTDGPFKQCHGTVDPTPYFSDCVFDTCQYNGQHEVLCKAISIYVAACQAQGIQIEPWRVNSFCSHICPRNSHYELCGNGCPVTCHGLAAPTGCEASCKEGCYCDVGFVLSGDQCVPIEDCGCEFQDKYYKKGEEFYPSASCQERCVCNDIRILECQETNCRASEICKVENGVQGCHPVGFGECSVAGGSHYLTFDKRAYDFQGTCTYTLAKLTRSDSQLTMFSVLVENEGFLTKRVVVSVHGYTAVMERATKWKVKVNGEFYTLPMSTYDGKLWVNQEGNNIIVQADFGLKVLYDTSSYVLVSIPKTYQGQVKGLCGNFNGDSFDDFTLPSGKSTQNVEEFGISWKVPMDGAHCSDGCGMKCPTCDETKTAPYRSERFCGIIQAISGPFHACHFFVNPADYFNNCLNDMCVGNGAGEILCRSIQAYVAACQAAGVAVRAWRSNTFCPLTCPSNSHYELCTRNCDATCTVLTTPGRCTKTCFEGCQCDSGYLFDGNRCVAVENCGCLYNGRYIKPNEKLLLNDCQESCTCYSHQGVICETHSCATDERCDTKDGFRSCIKKDLCKDLKCREKETCKIENNQAKCVPLHTGTCWGWGDPHYHTFDGFKFDFQGTCTYTFAKYCGNDPALVPFTVDEKNDNRGNQAVSYVRLVNIYVYGYKISIYKQETGRIRLNDAIKSLPLTLENGKIKLSQSGNNAVLQTDFGLQVTYDWNWHLIVTLPSSYYGAMCGLCGNFNQNPGDDMSLFDGTKAPSIERWASSWKVKDHDPFCWDSCKGNCPTCDEQKQQLYRKEEFCGLIGKSSGGPFRDCHFRVNPDNFLDSCTYDVCMNGGAKNILCQALEAYAKTCRKAGAIIQDWRTPSGCALQCPENSHYEFCGNACPASCADRSAPDTCKEPCVETCQCNDGFVLSVDKCVPVASCGCTYNGFYYKPGEQFWADENCGTRCRCDPRLGNVVCNQAGCKANERCTVVNGIRDCHPLSYATCSASGDPHYTTFDGRKYDFMGTCIYQLAGLCSDDPTLRPFAVYVQNNNRGNKKVSYTKAVTLEVYSVTITLSQEYPRRVQVNDVFVNLPFNHEDKVKVYISGNNGVIKTDFGLTVTFDWYSYVRVSVPNTYASAVCGLCGNNNQNPNDDLAMKDGSQARGIAQFAESWKVADVPGCSVGCTDDCPACAEAQKQTYQSNQYCGILRRTDGPFKQCHGTIDPTPYFSDCVFDTCQYNGQHEVLCKAISIYVAACQAQGIQIEPWRVNSFCSMINTNSTIQMNLHRWCNCWCNCVGCRKDDVKHVCCIHGLSWCHKGHICPRNSHYELCGNGCPVTCHGLAAPTGCEASCKEGCYCDVGFVLSGDQCIPIEDCGCKFQDKYYKKGEEFYPSASCQERCVCKDIRIVECQKTNCRASEICKVENGVQGCHPVGFGECSVAGGSHYLTFDKRAYDFQGTCTYTLAKLTRSDSQLTMFSVLVENEGSLTKRVVVSVHGYTAVMEKATKWKVMVNGEFYTLPMSTYDGKLWVNQEGNNIIVQADFGLKVLYDTSSYVLVSIPKTYQGQVNGLCGNFNCDSFDDFTLPSGKSTQNVDEFGVSWKVPMDGAHCSDGCGMKCPTCDATNTGLYRHGYSCGIIQATSGPFHACHFFVNPADYFDNCLNDMCVGNGAGEILCRSIQAYVAACQAAGVAVQAWRSNTFCPLTCPSNSHYELCTRNCDATCTSLSTPGRCTKKCFEGCQCDSGYLFDGNRCVAVGNCGCLYNGRYIKVGESIILDGCLERCTCRTSGQLICEKTRCQAKERCTLQDGVRGCFKEEGECLLTPGAQLTSFDGASGRILQNGAYEVASFYDEADPAWFRIVAIIQKCKDEDLAAVSTLHVFFKRTFITVKRSKETWVNGYQVGLPTKTSAYVSISASQVGVVIKLDSQAQVLLGVRGEVSVQVRGHLHGRVRASCGNFNGNAADDLKLPNGKVAENIAEVIDAWKARDFSGCDA